MKKIKNIPAGFTLIEIMVVVAIIGMLLGLVGPRVMKQLGAAKANTAKLQIADMGTTLDLYLLDVGNYPSTSEGLDALVRKTTDNTQWNGPYLKKNTVPKDPWGNAYHYVSPGQHSAYDLYSYGADNTPGGSSDDADIKSWE